MLKDRKRRSDGALPHQFGAMGKRSSDVSPDKESAESGTLIGVCGISDFSCFIMGKFYHSCGEKSIIWGIKNADNSGQKIVDYYGWPESTFLVFPGDKAANCRLKKQMQLPVAENSKRTWLHLYAPIAIL